MNINLEKEIKMEKQVLSIEQMEELEELGIDISGASMFWYINGKFKQLIPCSNQDTISDWTNQHGENCIIPAFTLQDILIRLPNMIIKDDVKYVLLLNTYHSYIAFTNSIWTGGKVFWFKDCSILDAAYKLLVWCLENKYI